MGSCIDLRDYEDNMDVTDAFSALVSGGKSGYKTVVEKRQDVPQCAGCNHKLRGQEKFCPECGTKQDA